MSPEDAVQAFESMGSSLTMFSPSGADPLADWPVLVAAQETELFRHVSDFSSILHSLTNGNDDPFQDGLKFLLYLTEQLTPP